MGITRWKRLDPIVWLTGLIGFAVCERGDYCHLIPNALLPGSTYPYAPLNWRVLSTLSGLMNPWNALSVQDASRPGAGFTSPGIGSRGARNLDGSRFPGWASSAFGALAPGA